MPIMDTYKHPSEIFSQGNVDLDSVLTNKIPDNEISDQQSVDFILVYEKSESKKEEERNSNRVCFENNLKHEGLILDYDQDDDQFFVKIHAPHEVLCRYSEIMKIKLPMKKFNQDDIMDEEYTYSESIIKIINYFRSFFNMDPIASTLDKYEIKAEFSRSKDYLFNVDDPSFFSQSLRISVVAFILDRTSYHISKGVVYDFGIERLLANGSYKLGYPVHEGLYLEPNTKRYFLTSTWAELKNWNKFQPIDKIKDYFGTKFAIYFAWLGFYTYMLISASIFGFVCFMMGVFTLHNDTYSNDICNSSLNVIMCPHCNDVCDYWKLSDSCIQAKITYLFDNNYNLAFAFFMALWSALYLEQWKRYSAEITHKWGLTGFDLEAEHPRPEYLAMLKDAKKTKRNVVTQTLEPAIPLWTVKLPHMILSYSIVLFLVALALGAVFSLIIYRMSLSTTKGIFGGKESTLIYRNVIIPCSAALLNLILITTLNFIYSKLALYLTNLEMLRTQTEVDDSLTLKIYMFKFVNYYSSIFYVAFVKGKLVGHPSKYNKIFGIRQEECSPHGCLYELFIQLAIIMVGRKLFSYLFEFLLKMYAQAVDAKRRYFAAESSDEFLVNKQKAKTQWTEDYKLSKWPVRGLFDEYLEMVLQYGFVTIFVAAFPLAPLFALIVNVVELRRDAKKFLKKHRRPIPCRARNIGVWLNIMSVLGRIAVVSNAFIIAFTSNFIPRLFYHNWGYKYGRGFLEQTLSYFDTNDFEFGAPENSTFGSVTMCRYRDYRNPPWETKGEKYHLSDLYWHILVGRLVFIVIFQNIIKMIRLVVDWTIPDISRKLKDQIKREAYLTNDIIIKEEAMRAKLRRNFP